MGVKSSKGAFKRLIEDNGWTVLSILVVLLMFGVVQFTQQAEQMIESKKVFFGNYVEGKYSIVFFECSSVFLEEDKTITEVVKQFPKNVQNDLQVIKTPSLGKECLDDKFNKIYFVGPEGSILASFLYDVDSQQLKNSILPYLAR